MCSSGFGQRKFSYRDPLSFVHQSGALLQENLTYMHTKFGPKYHWIPEVYRRMGLPVFEGVQEASERHSVQRKRKLERA